MLHVRDKFVPVRRVRVGGKKDEVWMRKGIKKDMLRRKQNGRGFSKVKLLRVKWSIRKLGMKLRAKLDKHKVFMRR